MKLLKSVKFMTIHAVCGLANCPCSRVLANADSHYCQRETVDSGLR